MIEQTESRNYPPHKAFSRRRFLSNGLKIMSATFAGASFWQSREASILNNEISRLEKESWIIKKNNDSALSNAQKNKILQRRTDQQKSHSRATGLLLGSVFAILQSHIIDYLPKIIKK